MRDDALTKAAYEAAILLRDCVPSWTIGTLIDYISDGLLAPRGSVEHHRAELLREWATATGRA